MNPASLLTFKKKFEEFSQRHPRFVQFLGTLKNNSLTEGSVIDVVVTQPDGQVFRSNIKLTQEDLDMIKSMM